MYQPDLEVLKQKTKADFKLVHDAHWKIECFHRVIKQVCNIERFYVRDEHAIRNHFYCSLRVFVKLQTLCFQKIIGNCYEISRQLFVPIIREFILENLDEAAMAWPRFEQTVNA